MTIDWVSSIGYFAAFLVGSTFYMKTMTHLRCFAIASNVCFILYAYYSTPIIYPVLVLHLFLIPLNSYRLFILVKDQWMQIDESRKLIDSTFHTHHLSRNELYLSK